MIKYVNFSAAMIATAVATTGHAATVSPMVVDLQTSGRNVVANVSVSNTSDKPLTIEAVPQALQPTETGLAASDASTDDLLVMPPTALIAPGRTQTFRVQWIGDPSDSTSRHYYVGMNQLPVKLPEGQSAVQVVYNFNVLVNVGPANGKADLKVVDSKIVPQEGKYYPSIAVSNSGSTYGYISQKSMKLVQTDASGKEVFSKSLTGSEIEQLVGYGIVAVNQTRTMVVPVSLPDSNGKLTASISD
jgi:P pilus assembly chaperone PapD